eukprot:2823328-Pyramimonas_sp.AAC.1
MASAKSQTHWFNQSVGHIAASCGGLSLPPWINPPNVAPRWPQACKGCPTTASGNVQEASRGPQKASNMFPRGPKRRLRGPYSSCPS